ncbi:MULTISPECIES: DUF2061 domain-containing protein [Roseivirga]|jgi:uncharacterized membrane protein|uniref:DUF2061 domain-containing protein n=1 Tax=Roseivirga thermotolerans TaxID=1758176 RepID=A0ABQ3I7L4_9BACT|nr:MULTISPECIES: DUF2061 domain-containing protein [Roseivirga]MEC7753598.1 DUF2061 domain-containing protein [Bacteroidota bacterium]GHE65655.1 hypothetical protein GCM10011340_21000 [Roseivirga thermotolerans]|tara:strand:- start:1111 stop:1356 length:246 start_codon:yes stop_codon:yes gene_type:complete
MLVDSLVKDKIEDARKVDSNLKSLLKTISWRIVGTLDTMVISYIITGNFATAFSIGSVEVVTKMILYYLHERVWASVKVRR